MMKTNYRNLLSLVLFTFSATAQAKNVALLIGGGGDESIRVAAKTESLKFIDSMNKFGWETKVLYGESGDSELKSNSFSRENFFSDLKFYANELKQGDHFLLNIVTEGRYARRGHELVLGDGSLVNLNEAEVREAFKTMNRNGVRIGVLDNSAYGGQTVHFMPKYVCVVSSQVPKFPSYEVIKDSKGNVQEKAYGVSTYVWDLLNSRKHATMEDVYISAAQRLEKTGVFPQISGIIEHEYDGENLSKLVNGLADQLSNFKGRVSKPGEEIGNKSFPHNLLWPLERGMFVDSWVVRNPDFQSKQLRGKFDLVDSKDALNKKLNFLEKERNRVLYSDEIKSKNTRNRREKHFSDRIDHTHDQYQKRINDFSNALNRAHSNNYLDMREIDGGIQLENCRNFNLNQTVELQRAKR
jgi:hypothetical protein